MPEVPGTKVLLIVTLDTKSREARFVREVLEAHGVGVVHLDASIRQHVPGAEIGPAAIAAAAGWTLEAVRDLKHEGKCQAVMTEGAIKVAEGLQRRREIAGVLGIGGSMGTTLATAVMRTLPYGLPKLMISTMASGFTRPFVGNRDLIMMNSVCDIAGLNTITRDVFRNGAIALAAMAQAYRPAASAADSPLVMISTLSTTDKCSVRVREALARRGFEVMVFHTLGTGGATLDAIVRERNVAAVVDMSLVEINDHLQGGLCSAGPDRAKAALEKGVPTVFAPGNIDFMVAGPIDQAKAQFPGKRYHMHNAALTAVRADAPELTALADHMASIIQDAKGPVSFLVPLKGFSAHDSEQGYLHDPSLPPVFAARLKAAMPAHVPVTEFDCHINDEAFADALVAEVLRYIHPGQRTD